MKVHKRSLNWEININHIGAMSAHEEGVWAHGHGTSICPGLTPGNEHRCGGEQCYTPPGLMMNIENHENLVSFVTRVKS